MRGKELCLQLNELIQGLSKMWKSILGCHRNQCQAIGEAEMPLHLTNALVMLSLKPLCSMNWALGFSCWVNAQKVYVRALNTWLMKCLLYVPDGRVPFSPGRIGAPPILVICNQFSQTIEGVSLLYARFCIKCPSALGAR